MGAAILMALDTIAMDTVRVAATISIGTIATTRLRTSGGEMAIPQEAT